MLKFRELFSEESSTPETKGENNAKVSADTEFAKLYEIRNMNVLISSEQKRQIVETVFENSEEKYQRVITIFNYLKSWQDATELLELIFHSNALNPLSEDAVEFASIIRNCFEE